MKKLRYLLWKILGINYYHYLNSKQNINLKDSSFAKVGNKTYDNGAYVWRWSTNSNLNIGKYCSIANDVHFICDSGFHTISEVTNFPLFYQILDKKDTVTINDQKYIVNEIKEKLIQKKSGINIANDVWIGANVTILPNVTIGNGSTILAGSVVTKNIPDYVIAGGVPAVVIKKKHCDQTITALNKIAWWDWDDSKVKNNINDFYLPIQEFIKKYK